MTLIDGKFLGFDVTPRTILFAISSFVIGYIFLNLARRATSPLLQIKAIPGWPILGQLPTVLARRDLPPLFREWMDYAGDLGIFRYFVFLGPERITIFKPEFLKHIFVTKCSRFIKPTELLKFLPNLGKAILTSDGQDHSWQRKLMNPLFSSTSVKKYIGSFDRHSLNLVKLWKEKCMGGVNGMVELTIVEDLRHMTMDVIGSTVFGYEFNTTLNGDDEVGSAFGRVLTDKMVMTGRLKRFLIPFYEYLPTSSNLEYKNAQKITTDLVDKLIKNKREKMEKAQGDSSEEDADLLSVIMRAKDEDSGQRMTDDLLKQNAWTFLLAGNDTTSTALTWTLYHLSRNPDVQEKAREEALRVIGSSEKISVDMANELEYMALVIKESLRITPSVGAITRNNPKREDMGNVVIPEKSLVLVPSFAIHTYHKFWDDPLSFKPERFMETNNPRSCGITGQTYLPFGSGPRSCIGSKFATLQMKVVLARLLTKFRFEMRPDHPEVIGKLVATNQPHPTPMLQVTLLNAKESEMKS